MNKQELKEKLKQLGVLTIYDNPNGQAVDMVVKSEVLALVDQLYEPKKVVIPKFVAEWLEACKSVGNSLGFALNLATAKVTNWLVLDDCKNRDVFAQAWIYGYEVEQEKLYTVEIPNPNRKGRGHARFRLEKSGNKVYLVKRKSSECYQNKDNQKLTEAEIKKDFEWAWKWAEEVKE